MGKRMTERVSDIGERARGRMVENRLDKVDRENDRLKHEVRMLRDDLQEERGALQRALDALARDEHVTVTTKGRKRRGRFLRIIAIGGGAYLLGARAGRERYEQIVDKAKGLKDSMRQRPDGETTWEPIGAPTGTTSPGTTSGSTTSRGGQIDTGSVGA
jgi:hypothetical protein